MGIILLLEYTLRPLHEANKFLIKLNNIKGVERKENGVEKLKAEGFTGSFNEES